MTMMILNGRPGQTPTRAMPPTSYDAMVAHGRRKWAEAIGQASAARRTGNRPLVAKSLGSAALWRGWTEESLRLRRRAACYRGGA